MAVSWSWAWGPETAYELETMGWNWEYGHPTFGYPENTITYTYPGSPPRYAWAQDKNGSFDSFDLPAAISFSPDGWFCAPIYAAGAQDLGKKMISVYGATSAREISVVTDSYITGEFKLMINNVEKGTWSVTPEDWHYIALKYSMSSAAEWGAEVFVNGVSVASGSTTPLNGETNGYYKCQGSHSPTYYGQFIIYDSLSDSGQIPRYVTRVNPTLDTTSSGSWTPVGEASNFAALSSSFDTTTYTNNPSADSGEMVVCKVSGALGLITQLGITPSVIDGITLHCWASGSGLNGRCGLSDTGDILTPGDWDNGFEVTPHINDPTYCFASSSARPSDDAYPWVATSPLFVKYEVI